jgi:uracil-DNA glycosylase family 4
MTESGGGSDVAGAWQEFVSLCRGCERCNLAATRRNVVVWRGALKAPLLIIGEGPGEEEDRQGIPFVGRSGKLLDTLLKAVEISEDSFHIANIVKCRPPGNRVPTLDEVASCMPLLKEQERLVGASIVLLMGGTAYKYYTGDQTPISRVRGFWIERDGLRIMPSFHPAYVLRNGLMRLPLYEDMMKVKAALEQLS